MSQTQAYFLDEDLQCSTDDDEDDEEDFQEVSEDENNAANILDQGERMHVHNDGTDYIDPKNIKTEIDIEAQQMAEEQCGEDDSQQAAEAMVQLSGVGYYAQQQQDESMDVDPNYDPSDFLAMHKPRQNFGENYTAANAFSEFMAQAQDDNGQYNPPEASTSTAAAGQQEDELPAATSNNNAMGIDDDLDISDSDDEDNGGVRIKKELLDDAEMAPQQSQQQAPQQIYLLDASNELAQPIDQPQQPNYQPGQELEQVQPTAMQQETEQQPTQGENDYDWLTF